MRSAYSFEKFTRLANIKKWDSLGTAAFFFHQVAIWQHRLGHESEAAFWIGCFQGVRDEADQPLEKLERPRFEKMVVEVRNALGHNAYQAAYGAGYGPDIPGGAYHQSGACTSDCGPVYRLSLLCVSEGSDRCRHYRHRIDSQ